MSDTPVRNRVLDVVYIDSINSNKMAAVYTIHVICFRIVTVKADAFSASQIDCTSLDNQMSEGKHRNGAFSVFSLGSPGQLGCDRR